MKRFLYILKLALLYTVIFSVAPIINDKYFLGLEGIASTKIMVITLISLFLFNFSILYLTSFNRAVFLIFLVLTFFIGGLITFHVYTLNFSFSYRSLILLLETNLQTFKNVLNLKMVVFVLLCLAFALLQIGHSKKNLISLKEDPFGKSPPMMLAVITAIFFIAFIAAGNMSVYLPQSIFASSYQYYEKFHTEHDKQMPQPSEYEGSDDLNVVVIVGESTRGDKFHINGYHRKTSPNLDKINNLVSYRNTSSCEVLSIIALPCLLTNRSIEDPLDHSKNLSFHTLFSENGFPTYWVNEHFHGAIKTEFEEISEGYDKRLFGREHAKPEETLPAIKSVIDQPGKKFIVYHSFLTHWPYYSRYPEEYNIWKPICSYKRVAKDFVRRGDIDNQISQMKKCSSEQLNNEYDNSILYIDKVVSDVVEMLKDKNAILIYTADHAESLGERGYYLHGGYEDRFIREQRNVPFMIWFSDKFLSDKNNQKKLENAKAKLSDHITHDNLFHSIIDCAGIKGADVNKGLSLCN